jgi:glutathione peroxidase
MRFLLTLAALAAVPALVVAEEKIEKKVPPVLNFKMKGIDGKDVDLSKFQGKVVLFVNVATYCGNTKQYKGLQSIYDKYGKEGLVVVGVPANEFGNQEPGTDKDIAKFCTTKYKVTFPMMSKVVVKGEGITPLYDYLTSKKTNPKFGGQIEWNFDKFLISREGKVVARFKPRTDPEKKEVIEKIESELKKK